MRYWVFLLSLFLAGTAQAKVTSQSEHGFAIVQKAEVDATREEVYASLLKPSKYWSPNHSWSGDADNFYIVPKVGGCFCENIPSADGGTDPTKSGEVEHMRVIFMQPGKVLRLQGALGPLQSEAVKGVLTIALHEADVGDGRKGTAIVFSYVVGGYMRYKVEEIGSSVDQVIGEQLKRLAALFETKKNEEEAEKPQAPAADPENLEEGR